jgi:hypothetical protein
MVETRVRLHRPHVEFTERRVDSTNELLSDRSGSLGADMIEHAVLLTDRLS